jgi:Holliday junction resolvase-like predicted endonuclease
MKTRISSWHVAVAAEAIVAAQFARLGYDVSVQYGANQPEYDLIVVSESRLLKVSVKGSQDGSWGLAQSLLTPKRADYHAAAERWLGRHKPQTAICFVQFKSVPVDKLPRLYLASPSEVAERLRKTAKGRGDTILYEHKIWTARAVGAGTEERIPESWTLSAARVDQVIRAVSTLG